MRDEAGRIVSPNDFIAAAERYGIMPAIDRWVIENALSLAGLRGRRARDPVAVLDQSLRAEPRG
jgi:EAL domain-containing protein (putative c-di-GMP-specific phosphodiesterase class I)